MPDTTLPLKLLAEQAIAAAQALDSALEAVQGLRSHMLAHIDELSGDREFNWQLQADLGNAESAVFSTAYKARTVARHALEVAS